MRSVRSTLIRGFVVACVCSPRAFALDSRATTVTLGPDAQAYASVAITWSNSTWQKIPINTVDFDTGGMFDTTNTRFRPNKAGYYKVVVALQYNMSGTGGFTIFAALYQNGSFLKQSESLINYGGAFNQTVFLITLVRLNGTTDYLEAYGYSNAGSPQVLGGGSNTWMSVEFVRSP